MAPTEDPETVQAHRGPTSREGTSFEDAYGRLNETVRALESGSLTLEEATRLYEEGMALVRLCNELLTAAELKVTQLKEVHADPSRQSPPEEGQ